MKLDDLWPRMELEAMRTNSTQSEGGYASRRSLYPGEKLTLHLSTSCSRFQLDIYREGAKRKKVMTLKNLRGAVHSVPAKGYATGFRWPASVELTIPGDWPSGVYTCNFPTEFGTKRLIFVVKSRAAASELVLCLGDNTYQAYNAMGGKSMYGHISTDQQASPLVSFQRPYLGEGTGLFPIWERPLIRWMEAGGYQLDYICQEDLDRRPEILDSYRCLIKAGHDEYWTRQELEAVQKFVARGGHLAVFSGNTCWWQVRFQDTVMACYRKPEKDPLSKKHPELTTSELVHPPLDVPVQQLIGLRFDRGGFVNSHGHYSDRDGYGGYHAYNTQHWAYDGTSIREGQCFGQEATIAGYEVDGIVITWKDGRPRVSAGDFDWGLRRNRDRLLEDYHVLGISPAGHEYTLGAKPHALAIIYEPPGRGHVFNAGSTDWAHGLQMRDPVVESMTRNVLDRFTSGQFPPTFVNWRPVEVKATFQPQWEWYYTSRRRLVIQLGQEVKFEVKARGGATGEKLRYAWYAGRESIGRGRYLVYRPAARGTHRIDAEVTGRHGSRRIGWKIKVT
jgi:hypothetical protein